MAEVIDTAEGARERMIEWANGGLSHWNLMMEVETDFDSRQQTMANAAVADAAEVQKWAALYVALRGES